MFCIFCSLHFSCAFVYSSIFFCLPLYLNAFQFPLRFQILIALKISKLWGRCQEMVYQLCYAWLHIYMLTALLRTCQVHIACDRHRHLDSLPSQYITHCILSFPQREFKKYSRSNWSAIICNSNVSLQWKVLYCDIVFVTLQSSLIVICVIVSSILCNCISYLVYLLENIPS